MPDWLEFFSAIYSCNLKDLFLHGFPHFLFFSYSFLIWSRSSILSLRTMLQFLLYSFYLYGFPLSFLVRILGLSVPSSFHLEFTLTFYLSTHIPCSSLGSSVSFPSALSLCFLGHLSDLFSLSSFSWNLLSCFLVSSLNSLNSSMTFLIFF